MSLATALLVPFLLLLPAAEAAPPCEDNGASGLCQRQDSDAIPVNLGEIWQGGVAGSDSMSESVMPAGFYLQRFQPDTQYQVRIERSIRIRIAPQSRTQMPHTRPDMFFGVPQLAASGSLVERRMGKCLPVSSIAGVQPDGGDDLILYLRDRRIVRAKLERSCRARDYYSGFYLSGSSDGRLCVDRDILQSRSGANCKLSRIRQLVEAGD